MVQYHVYSDLSIINIDVKTEKYFEAPAKREVLKHFQTMWSVKCNITELQN